MRYTNKARLCTLAMIISLALLLYGCGGTEQPPPEQTPTGPATTEETPGRTAPEVTEETELTERLKQENEVQSGRIYIEDDAVSCAITIKPEADVEAAKALAQRYADELKQKYGDKDINVQAVQGGKNIASIQYEAGAE